MKNKNEVLKIVVGLLIIAAVIFGVLSKGKSGSSTGGSESDSGSKAAESGNTKQVSSAEYVNNERYLCDVALGFRFDENLFFNKGDKEAKIILDGKEVATIDKEDSIYMKAYLKEGKHKVTIKTGWLGDSSVEFEAVRREINCFAYELKDKGKKVNIEENKSYNFPSDDSRYICLGDYKIIKNDIMTADFYESGYMQIGNLYLTLPYYPDMEDTDNGFHGNMYDYYKTGDVDFWSEDLANYDTEDALKQLLKDGILKDEYSEIHDIKAFSVEGYPAVSCKYIQNWDTDLDTQDYLDDICGKRASTVHAAVLYCEGTVYFLTEDMTFLSDELQDIAFQEALDSFTIVEDEEADEETQVTVEESSESMLMPEVTMEESTEAVIEPKTAEETMEAEDTDREYILPGSDATYLAEKELTNLSQDELRYAVNEIYARHHRRFKDAQLQAYFDAKSWYTGTVEPEDFDEKTLNAYEKENVKVIRAYIEKTK